MLAGLLSVSSLLGCGDPLVDGRYRGEPLMVVEGDVLFLDEPPDELPAAELRVAVFWSAAGALQDDTIEAVDSIQEQVVTTGSFPARYQMYIYTPPPESLLEEVPGAEGQQAVIGMVLLYLDVDGNQRWSGAEAFERQPSQRHDVYGQPIEIHQCESGDNGNRNGNADDQRGTKTVQKEKVTPQILLSKKNLILKFWIGLAMRLFRS